MEKGREGLLCVLKRRLCEVEAQLATTRTTYKSILGLQTVMNLVPTHSNCTSPLDYISHHALHSHIPVHHYTNHTAVTIHSSTLIASPHLHLILSLT